MTRHTLLHHMKGTVVLAEENGEYYIIDGKTIYAVNTQWLEDISNFVLGKSLESLTAKKLGLDSADAMTYLEANLRIDIGKWHGILIEDINTFVNHD